MTKGRSSRFKIPVIHLLIAGTFVEIILRGKPRIYFALYYVEYSGTKATALLVKTPGEQGKRITGSHPSTGKKNYSTRFSDGWIACSNVTEAIKMVNPYRVDICISLRTGGPFDEQKLRDFMYAGLLLKKLCQEILLIGKE